jgi:lipopolysaccharide transport system ATP-binding protein
MTNLVMEVRDVSVRYKTRRSFFRHSYFAALDRISFSIEKGETLGVVGRNGCGKSTLLKVLAHVYDVDGGKVVRHCRNVSLLSLSLGFDPELSGRDNAIISGMLLGARKRDVLREMDEIISFSELDEFIDKPIKTYSTGMTARLGFSVALRMQSELLLIDEVLGVGDGKFRAKASEALESKITSDQTVVLVSHSTNQIEELCTRVLWLDHGRIVRIGATQEVLGEYGEFVKSSAVLPPNLQVG